MAPAIQHNVPLKALNTFSVEAVAENYIIVRTASELTEALASHHEQLFVLGGGSNVLFVKQAIAGLVLHVDIKGIEVVRQNDDTVIVRAMAGENWHQFVCWCLDHDYGGLENLSLIPGNVGAAPVQNIGAYGVELKDVLLEVDAIHIASGQTRVFTRDECQLAYRDSIFKSSQQGQWIILSISVRLTKHDHILKLEYGAVQERLAQGGVQSPTIVDISQAVIAIRQERLPDPITIPNAGSFFKNPIISQQAYQALKIKYPDIPGYGLENGQIKIPAGWLIEQCGWKGKRHGRCAVHNVHALVIVNDGGADGREILTLAGEIQASVENHYQLRLAFEVNVLDVA